MRNAALQDALLEILVVRMDGALTGASLVDWATRALAEGLDSESLVYLAGLPGDCSVFDAGPLLDRSLAELGQVVPPAAELRRAYVGAVSRALLGGTIDVESALDRIHRSAVSPLDHPADLAPWCFTWEGLDANDYHSLSAGEVAAVARRLAGEWAGHFL